MSLNITEDISYLNSIFMTHDLKICIYPGLLNIHECFLYEIDQGK